METEKRGCRKLDSSKSGSPFFELKDREKKKHRSDRSVLGIDVQRSVRIGLFLL